VVKVLLVNPPIYDFAAFDFWMKPYGLLRLGGALKSVGHTVKLCDFADKDSFREELGFKGKTDQYGRGKLPYKIVQTPPVIQKIRRKYKRYGLPADYFEKILADWQPDAVFLTCAMTYWYPGVLEVAQTVRKFAPSSYIALGGQYAAILPEHAQKLISPDFLHGRDSPDNFRRKFGCLPDKDAIPLWREYRKLPYGVIRLTEGCPFECSYCAVRKIVRYRIRPLDWAVREAQELHSLGVQDVAFYDDALLFDFDRVLLPFLTEISKRAIGFRFHTPNGLHVRFITKEVAQKLKNANFISLFLSLETASQTSPLTQGKVTRRQFESAVSSLTDAGFTPSNISVYLLLGHPLISPEEVVSSVHYVNSLGLSSHLAEFSPIPGTPDGDLALKPLSPDPLVQNKTLYSSLALTEEKLSRIKLLARRLNSSLTSVSREFGKVEY
jgi:pyruvate-formate lyase-activating enzyme